MALRPRFSGICFDLDDTLVDREAAFARALAILGDELPPVALDELRALDARGRGDRGALAAHLVERFPGLGPQEALEDALQFAIVMAVRPRPEVSALVGRLAARYRLAVVSNGGARQREKLARAGLAAFFSEGRVLVSSELGLEKPDPRIFARALAALGLEAGEVLHVGDDPARDVLGAQRAGLATCWLARGPYPPGLPAPGFAIRALAELPALLEAG